jgi:hypothetical protein
MSGPITIYHRPVGEPIEIMLPLNIYARQPDDTTRRVQAVGDAATEAFGATPEITAREVEIGRGADAGALIMQIAEAVGFGVAVVLGPAELVRKGREALGEYRAWARNAKRFIDRLRGGDYPPTMLSSNLATAVLVVEVEARVGPITRLVWWDELIVQPFEWVDDPTRFEATAERLYFYVFETQRSRWFVATKGDGTIVSEAETLIPADYIEYALWRRDGDPEGPDTG